jgi:hypothetical protein
MNIGIDLKLIWRDKIIYACLILCLNGILLGRIIIRNHSLFDKKIQSKGLPFWSFYSLVKCHFGCVDFDIVFLLGSHVTF